ncbi:MAG: teichoic acid D-Ala incorporation-associated protein DltX [Sporolactobacillus sp.]
MKNFVNWAHHPAVSWFAQLLFYVIILFALIAIYGFASAHTGTFIYSDF